jgi:hypothetical protein
MTHAHDHSDDHHHHHEDGKEDEHALHHRVHEAAGQIDVGAYYEHRNGQLYRVLGLGFIEANNELAVVYQAQYGEKLMWIRPLTNFVEEVDGKPRFRKVAENDAV